MRYKGSAMSYAATLGLENPFIMTVWPIFDRGGYIYACYTVVWSRKGEAGLNQQIMHRWFVLDSTVCLLTGRRAKGRPEKRREMFGFGIPADCWCRFRRFRRFRSLFNRKPPCRCWKVFLVFSLHVSSSFSLWIWTENIRLNWLVDPIVTGTTCFSWHLRNAHLSPPLLGLWLKSLSRIN